MLFDNLAYSWSEFQRVGTAIKHSSASMRCPCNDDDTSDNNRVN